MSYHVTSDYLQIIIYLTNLYIYLVFYSIKMITIR